MKSPFQYGTLVDKENFVNRVEERKQLKEWLGSGINVMLISPRRWGKSSLVKVAMDELMHEDKQVRVCYIDAFSIKTESEFYRTFARKDSYSQKHTSDSLYRRISTASTTTRLQRSGR